MNILVFICAFIAGVLLASFVSISLPVGVLVVVVGVVILLAEKLARGRIAKEVWFVGLALIAFGCGSVRYAIKDSHTANPAIEHSVGTSIDLVGVIANEPDIRDADNRFIFETGGEKILVSAPLFSNVEYGDEVEVKGKLERPGVITNDTGDFDYGAYLAREDIYYTISFARVDVVTSGKGNAILSGLYSLKHSFERRIERIEPQPEAALLEGLIVAGKQALPKSIQNDFIKAGVVHIVVLSGYNVTIVAEFLLLIFSFLALRLAFGASAIGIAIFVLMTGASASVVRAAAMALIALGGRLIGRTYSVSRALLAAAFVMLVWNPKILVFDPSFQLSFLATIAMIYVAPIFEERMTKVPAKFGLRTLIAVTLGTQLFVLPYLLYQTGLVSIMSPVSNLLILPLVPVTMLVGFIAAALAYVSPIVAVPLAYPAHLLLSWILFVAHAVGSLSFGSFAVQDFPFWAVLLLYGCFIALLYRARKGGKKEAPSGASPVSSSGERSI